MKELSREEMQSISGGGFWGVVSRFFRISETVYAPSEPDAVGETRRIEKEEIKVNLTIYSCI